MIALPPRKYSSTTPDNVINDIASGDAIPAIDMLKRSIVESLIIINNKESELLRARAMNNGLTPTGKKIDFACSLIFSFNLIKGMVKSKGIYNQWSPNNPAERIPFNSDFSKMEQLELGKDFSVNELIHLKNYIIYILHKLKLTNLLIEMEIDLDKALKEEF